MSFDRRERLAIARLMADKLRAALGQSINIGAMTAHTGAGA